MPPKDPASSPRPSRPSRLESPSSVTNSPPQLSPLHWFSLSRPNPPRTGSSGSLTARLIPNMEPASSVIIPSDLLQRHTPSSYVEPSSLSRLPVALGLNRSYNMPFSNTADGIRDRTVMLSTLSISPTTPLTTGTPADEYFGPALPTHFEVSETSESPGSVRKGGKDKDKDAEDAINIERGSPSKSILKSSGPSTLTLQLKRNSNPSSTAGSRDVSPLRPEQSPSVVPMPEMNTITPPSQVQAMPSSAESFLSPARPAGRIKIPAIITPTEETRLISDAILPAYTISQPDSRPIHKPEPRRSKSLSKHFRVAVDQAKVATKPSFWVDVSLRSINALPAVFLGLLLNILDAVSYGMIIFPAGDMFQGLGPMGVSLFFVTTVVAQFIYTFGASAFHGGNGSMMIEVVPFFNILTAEIIEIVGEDNPRAVIATTLAAFAFSSILTGITFFIFGKFKLGNIIGFFPRHILVGCIGGIGWFLIETGFEVSTGMNEEGGFQYNLPMLKFLFGSGRIMALWMSALFLAVALRLITEKYHHHLIFPIYFLAIPLVFYIVVATGHFDLSHLRETGWLFDVGDADEPWWQFYTYWDFRQINYMALLRTMPTQLALLFFNILHPPLNVPALAVSVDQDVDTNKELVAHGYSNILAGFLGVPPNYLVYVNSVLFYRVGGDSRLAGFLLGVATLMVMLAGTAPIGYLPVMVVGALIFVLGIDLVREAIWDTRHRVSKSEYVTILSIIICMTVFDFVIGVLFGIVLACFFFVVQNSQNRSIRAFYTGDSAMSTVRRPSAHRKYLQEVGKQTAIMKLQSYLFFGTIAYVEESVRELLDTKKWSSNPIRFLLVDFSLVLGVDLSASEAFVRLQRLLASKSVTLVLCGFYLDSPIGRALENVALFQGSNVEVFSDMNEALEWTENVYLKAWYDMIKDEQRESEPRFIALPGRVNSTFTMSESWQQSPRRSQIHNVGGRFMRNLFRLAEENQPESSRSHEAPEPAPTLVKTFSGYEADLTPTFFEPILRYFTRVAPPEGATLWRQGDKPDGIYVVEAGVLRAVYNWDNSDVITESMVPGTLAGELSGLANMPRNATVTAEKAPVLWKLSNENWTLFKEEQPGLAHRFMELVLKVAKSDYDVLLSACSRR